MSSATAPAPCADTDIDLWLARQTGKSLLRFLTCGSVDDGKSTLIGRLLYDSQMILDDQLASLKKDSRNRHVGEEGIDFSLLVDGLVAEREQGITIDVAYRFFSTDRRKFIVADTPGHEQYTRNMATGASNADVALLLVDARKGLLTQTRRHSFILSLFGVKHVALVVNKIDLMDYSQEVFARIEAEYRAFVTELGFASLAAVPISALRGDNIVAKSERTPWYTGSPLLSYLEDIAVDEDRTQTPFRFPVQWVNRPNLDFRGFSGTVASGTVRVGDEILVSSSRKPAAIARIVTMDGDLPEAAAEQAVTLVLDREIDISRGDVLTHSGQTPEFSNQFQAELVWMADEPAYPGRSYLLKIGSQVVPATITDLKHRTNVNTLKKAAAKRLELNEVGTVTIATDRPIAFDPYNTNRLTGGFILIDRIHNLTLGAGTIAYGLQRARNLSYQSFDVNREVRAGMKGQTPQIVWFTGLSGSGKSTVANLLEKRLTAEGKHAYILDGDNVRHGLNKDLGFTDAARVENIRRVAEVARLMADAGLIVIVSFISPFANERRIAREIAANIRFLEAYVDTPLEVCEARDPKGLYAKARAGQITNFTGVDSPFEVPQDPDITLRGAVASSEEMADIIYERVVRTDQAK
ncbi:sulfate adenylyltransferase subunit CysN [Sinorhizobium meliloti]|uniref:Multifunctional fusion protein n=3 Tax=Rhizobium meliloti TaxID=382 RepID=Q1WLL0_SINMM|nr:MULTISPECIES: sulfate adenylyltransferase subunit CysN [Sinorhizobium]ABA55990.1 sulfate adenylate transferase subunit 1 [Sinorhizobium meliloti]ARS66010.1 adenylyl-sulfate kinase [Sinorhizobium meliloti RU11/001]MBP2471035.1 bifunctional enzyme CysN/CysC [Sinorhizobium meliloti]MDE3768668.1 sulfate adenylyltransferase subunit CysN [Sinorhizobium meliloti]MDE3777683.1 sulfate adenylyltransferase subunit CysN [Sinorhizobium meliloti]